MGNPFAKFGVTDSEVAEALRNSAEVDAALNEKMENEIVPYGRSVSPVDSGKYAASWQVIQKAKRGRGVVGPTDWKAHIIEFGSGSDSKGGNKERYRPRAGVKLGPGTPTRAHGTVQKVAEHFGGDLSDGIGDQG